MHLRAAAVVDGPGSTCQAKLQNPKVTSFCHLQARSSNFHAHLAKQVPFA